MFQYTFFKKIFLQIFILLFFIPAISFANTEIPLLNTQQLNAIGKKIYQNETGSNPAYLIAWNNGESFASLGLGHFIWFPEGLKSPFTETFPALVEYLQRQGVVVPTWLKKQRYCPWQSKQAFQNAQGSKQMKELRVLLESTFEHQVNFIHQRMRKALPSMLENITNERDKSKVTEHFYKLTTNELGMYALIDYVNFKGEGVSKTEKYKGQGWGLLQVLLNINDNTKSINAAFSQSCKYVLARRVENSPQQDVEQKWLPGWRKRCDTYLL